ncbi:MAG: hypothetical protein KIS61_09970, partial [Candidatus Eremiobacteraeota bacterium]|nr:hypothetical protein [Candidatus Eremiobacteraeota bacterium]
MFDSKALGASSQPFLPDFKVPARNRRDLSQTAIGPQRQHEQNLNLLRQLRGRWTTLLESEQTARLRQESATYLSRLAPHEHIQGRELRLLQQMTAGSARPTLSEEGVPIEADPKKALKDLDKKIRSLSARSTDGGDPTNPAKVSRAEVQVFGAQQPMKTGTFQGVQSELRAQRDSEAHAETLAQRPEPKTHTVGSRVQGSLTEVVQNRTTLPFEGREERKTLVAPSRPAQPRAQRRTEPAPPRPQPVSPQPAPERPLPRGIQDPKQPMRTSERDHSPQRTPEKVRPETHLPVDPALVKQPEQRRAENASRRPGPEVPVRKPELIQPKAAEVRKSLESGPVQPRAVDVRKSEPGQIQPKSVEVRKPEPGPIQPKAVEVRKPEPGALQPKAVDVRKPEPGSSQPKAVDVRRPEPGRIQPKAVEVRKPEPGLSQPKVADVRQSEQGLSQSKAVEVRKPEPGPLQPKAVEVRKPEPGPIQPKSVEVRKPEPGLVQPKSVEVRKPEPGPLQPKAVDVRQPEPGPIQPKAVDVRQPEPVLIQPKTVEVPMPEAGPVRPKVADVRQPERGRIQPQAFAPRKSEAEAAQTRPAALRKLDQPGSAEGSRQPEPPVAESRQLEIRPPEHQPEPKLPIEAVPEPARAERQSTGELVQKKAVEAKKEPPRPAPPEDFLRPKEEPAPVPPLENKPLNALRTLAPLTTVKAATLEKGGEARTKYPEWLQVKLSEDATPAYLTSLPGLQRSPKPVDTQPLKVPQQAVDALSKTDFRRADEVREVASPQRVVEALAQTAPLATAAKASQLFQSVVGQGLMASQKPAQDAPKTSEPQRRSVYDDEKERDKGGIAPVGGGGAPGAGRISGKSEIIETRGLGAVLSGSVGKRDGADAGKASLPHLAAGWGASPPPDSEAKLANGRTVTAESPIHSPALDELAVRLKQGKPLPLVAQEREKPRPLFFDQSEEHHSRFKEEDSKLERLEKSGALVQAFHQAEAGNNTKKREEVATAQQ